MSDNGLGDVPVYLGFTSQEWGLIRSALYELPAKFSVPIIGKLESQLHAKLRQPAKEGTP